MKGIQIFGNWALTVIAGSFVLPFLLIMIVGGGMEPGLFILVAVILSGLCSLPTLLALLIVASTYSEAPLAKKRRALNITHMIMGVLTILVGCLWLYKNESTEDVLHYFLVVIYYGALAALFWFFAYRRENAKLQKAATDETEKIA